MAKIYNKLPHAVTDLEDEFKVVFVGRAAPRKEQLAAEGWVRRVFGVRRWKVAAALQWLKRNNPLYAHVEIDSTALDALPNDGSVPASLWNAVQISTDVKAPAKEQSGYVQQPDNPATTRLDELAASSGLSDSKRGGVSRAGMSQSSVDHSAERKQDWQDPVSGVRPRSGASKAKDAAPLLEVPIRTSGWLDERGSTVSAQSVHSYAIQNALPRSSDPGEQSLYYLQHADAPVSELTEPRYLELAYPALFPFGRGGFDFTGRSKRPTRLSPQNYARRLMMLCDPRFRLHFSFKYILANVMMRRDVMRRASAKSKAIGFIEDSRDIAALQGKEVVAAIEELHKQPPGSVCKDPALAKFLRYINTWGGSIPNSDQWKRRVRQQIYAMVPLYGCVFPKCLLLAEFSLPHSPPTFFFTINPRYHSGPLCPFFRFTLCSTATCTVRSAPGSVVRTWTCACMAKRIGCPTSERARSQLRRILLVRRCSSTRLHARSSVAFLAPIPMLASRSLTIGLVCWAMCRRISPSRSIRIVVHCICTVSRGRAVR